MQPLVGITVISLEVAVAAPFASRQLADLGARVIKIERPGTGDFARGYDNKANDLSSHFAWTNRSKESLTLNLKNESGKKILEQLVQKADVFIHNLSPGAIDRLGFATERLRNDHPQLIICIISGYGSTGPNRNKKTYDLLIQAEAGLLSITGTAGTPSKAGLSVADIAAGMYAYSGVLTALLARHKTSAGSVIEVSLLEALSEWMGFPAYYSLGGSAPQRNAASHASIAPYGPFTSGDGGVFVGVKVFQYLGPNVAEYILPVLPKKVAHDYRRSKKSPIRKRFDIIFDLYRLESLSLAEIEQLNTSSTQQAADHLAEGGVLMIFPNGGRDLSCSWYRGIG